MYDCENKLIGYVDSETAHKIFYLKTKEIHGHIKDVEEHNVTLTITVISLLSEEESKAILDEDNNKIISIYYPQYANMAFGKDVPTFSQFDYALDLGINPNGKTFKSISTAIDKAKERIQQGGKKEPFPISHEHRSFFYDMLIDNAPASTDYLREIRELHGELPGPITNKEAEEVIALIGDPDYTIICPYCHHRVPNMDMCFNCDRSFRKVKIPLYFDDDKKQTETAYKSYKIAQEEQKYNEYNARVILVLVIVVICIVLLCKSCYT